MNDETEEEVQYSPPGESPAGEEREEGNPFSSHHWDETNPWSPMYRDHLYSLDDAASEVQTASGFGDTAGASAKLAAKAVANTAVVGAKVGLIAAKFGFAVLKKMGEEAAARAGK